MQTITQKTLTDTMYYNNIPVFIYQINYPFFTTTCNAMASVSVNAYYYNGAKKTEKYCRTVLFGQTLETAGYMRDSRPFHSYSLHADYKITYNSRCVTSLFTDTYTYMGGAHGETKRSSETWNFITGTQMKLNDVYPAASESLTQLLGSIGQQITERTAENPGSYFDDYKILLRNAFHPDSFYLRPGTGVIYYQQYDVAPYSTGLPEFYFPIYAQL